MKASKFSDAQKAFILKQGADGFPVAEICRRAGISQATYFNWKKKYDGLGGSRSACISVCRCRTSAIPIATTPKTFSRVLLQN